MKILLLFLLTTFQTIVLNGGVELSVDHQSLEASSVYYGLSVVASRRKGDSNSDCIQKLSVASSAIREKKIWALKLMDASGSPRSGVYWGNTYWMGSYWQCLSAHSGQPLYLTPEYSPTTYETNETLVPYPVTYFGAYFYHHSRFQLFIHWENETKISLGLCLPLSCTTEEISDLLQEYFDSGRLLYQQVYNTSLAVHEVKKRPDDKIQWEDPMITLFLSWTATAFCLGALGTLYDFFSVDLKCPIKDVCHITGLSCVIVINNDCAGKKKDMNKIENILVGFSWHSNFKKIFTTKVTKDTLLPFIGLRLFLTTSVIFSHCCLYMKDFMANRPFMMMYLSTLIGQMVENTQYSVDMFFFLGGFLLVYNLSKSKDLDEGDKLSSWTLFKLYLKGIFKRFIRLTPIYMYILLAAYFYSSFLNPRILIWTNERYDIQCKEYWWTNLLYINNIYPAKWNHKCLSWSWYMASDMQFFIITSCLYYISIKYFKTAVILTIGLLSGCYTVTGIVTYMYHFKPFNDNIFYISASLFYYPPWVRIAPYIIGALYGYLYRRIDGKLHIRKIYIYTLWFLSICLTSYLFLCFGDKDFSLVKSVLHTTFSRSAVSLGIGWMIFACLSGHGGIVNTILSAEGWRPMGHLTYAAYLLNPFILYLLISCLDGAWRFDETSVLLTASGLILLTYLMSLFYVIAVEYPFDNLLKVLMNCWTCKKVVDGKWSMDLKAKQCFLKGNQPEIKKQSQT